MAPQRGRVMQVRSSHQENIPNELAAGHAHRQDAQHALDIKPVIFIPVRRERDDILIERQFLPVLGEKHRKFMCYRVETLPAELRRFEARESAGFQQRSFVSHRRPHSVPWGVPSICPWRKGFRPSCRNAARGNPVHLVPYRSPPQKSALTVTVLAAPVL